MNQQVIVVGGGLSGLSAAHTVLQAGGKVLLLDKNAFMGGNSTKATSGINGAGTKTQKAMGVPDSAEIFNEDTTRSATGVKKGPCPPTYPLGTVLTHESAAAVDWLIEEFGLILDTVSRLGGHSHPRTHRRKSGGKFPGMMITYALMERYEAICESGSGQARLINKARVNKLITDASGAVIGCEYTKDGQQHSEFGPVVIATGGYGAGIFEKGSILDKIRPELMHLPTTNGKHCTGDGITVSLEAGAGAVGLDDVQVHPTGLVHPDDPENRTKFLAAGALRGEGGILLTNDGHRFCNELGTRDYVTGMMWDTKKAPYRLVLNAKAVAGIAWHCHHYAGRGVMKKHANAASLAAEMNVPVSTIESTFKKYNAVAKNDNDPWDKKYFNATPFDADEELHVAIVTPVVHYTMGGIHVDTGAAVLKEGGGAPLGGLFAAGEAVGGVHGKNRLGGSALLECVVFGRVAGASVVDYLKSGNYSRPAPAVSTLGSVITINIKQPDGKEVTVTISPDGQVSGGVAAAAPAVAAAPAPAPAVPEGPKEFSLEDVAKHNTEDDCWVVVNGKVLDVTTFLDDHPGGKMAVMTFAGKDSTEMFNMVHEDGTLEKYASDLIIGTLKVSGAKL